MTASASTLERATWDALVAEQVVDERIADEPEDAAEAVALRS